MSGLPQTEFNSGEFDLFGDEDERNETINRAIENIPETGGAASVGEALDRVDESEGTLSNIGSQAGALAEVTTLPSRMAGSAAADAATGGEGEASIQSAFGAADREIWENTPLDPEAELAGPVPGTVGDVARMFVGEPIDSTIRALTGTRPFEIQQESDEPFTGIEALDLAFAPFGLAGSGAKAGVGRGISRITPGSATDEIATGAASAGTTMSFSSALRGVGRVADEDVARSIARMDFDEFSSVSTRAGVDDTFTSGTRTAREGAFDEAGGLTRVFDELPSTRQTGTDLGSLRAGDDVITTTGETGGRTFDEAISSVDDSLSSGFDDLTRGFDDTVPALGRQTETAEDIGDFTADTGRAADDAVTPAARGADDGAGGFVRTADDAADEAAEESVGTLGQVTSSVSSGVSRATSVIRNNPLMAALGLGTAGYLAVSSVYDGNVPTTAQDGPFLYELVDEPVVKREEGVDIPGLIFRITRNDEELGYTVFVNKTDRLSESGTPTRANMSLGQLERAGGQVASESPNYTPLEPVFDTLSTARRVFVEWAEGMTAPDDTFGADDPSRDDDSESSGRDGWGNSEIVRELGSGWYLARQTNNQSGEQRFAVVGRDSNGNNIYLTRNGRPRRQPTTFDDRETALQAFQAWRQRARQGQTENEPSPSPDASRPTSGDVGNDLEGSGGVLSTVTENPRVAAIGVAVAFIAIYYVSDGEPVAWLSDKLEVLPFVGE